MFPYLFKEINVFAGEWEEECVLTSLNPTRVKSDPNDVLLLFIKLIRLPTSSSTHHPPITSIEKDSPTYSAHSLTSRMQLVAEPKAQAQAYP